MIVQQTAETLLQLAELGNAILIGRGGSVVMAKLPGILNVRLVAALEDRLERICRDDHKTPVEARRFCLAEEHARARYLKTYFNADINDPIQYHFIINTSPVGYENAARLITDALLLATENFTLGCPAAAGNLWPCRFWKNFRPNAAPGWGILLPCCCCWSSSPDSAGSGGTKGIQGKSPEPVRLRRFNP